MEHELVLDKSDPEWMVLLADGVELVAAGFLSAQDVFEALAEFDPVGEYTIKIDELDEDY